MKIGKRMWRLRWFPASGLLRGTAGHFGVFFNYQSLIRRGGAPSGAAATIITGGMGVSTPIINSGMKRFSWEFLNKNKN
jgi:hypothetical protein